MTSWGRLFRIILQLILPYASIYCVHPLHTHSVLGLTTVKVLDLTVMNHLNSQPIVVVRSKIYAAIHMHAYVHTYVHTLVWKII